MVMVVMMVVVAASRASGMHPLGGSSAAGGHSGAILGRGTQEIVENVDDCADTPPWLAVRVLQGRVQSA